MASQGPNNFSTFVDDASIGNKAWSNPASAQTSNDVRSSAYLSQAGGGTDVTHYLKATGPGFTIPSDAAIVGIAFDLERQADGTANGAQDNSVKFVKGGVIQGNDLKKTGVTWPADDAYTSYGGPTELGGLSWTPADINAANVGVAISAKNGTAGSRTLYIDHVGNMTVYYTPVVVPTVTTEAASGVGLD